ncbi:hypothetical protein A3D62_03230 [Candidatus Kaiserbacteria bacterium RIFCSPHIGHO2_02_FULL_49_11]|uniref:Uncharacterized protein n=1 Tax=Candidatus Kaiserbacteria bacterium RIFCSPHIGHO2_02_FULL_49_11 TaxID=1798489 RepID=A0A1F6D0S2_9BACT|nr:MAG: hypothetical protein A3D62_03230 [Candidatus Kaiserbacteria bacterium RIFCSPHIGHO2_02_FULL_49_11]
MSAYLNINYITRVALLAIVFSFGMTQVYAAWSGPSAVPPGSNISTPINNGTTDQIKSGGLGAEVVSVFGQGSFDGEVIVGNSQAECDADLEGALRHVASSGLELCNGEEWQAI